MRRDLICVDTASASERFDFLAFRRVIFMTRLQE
jgi:hypothetical protein